MQKAKADQAAREEAPASVGDGSEIPDEGSAREEAPKSVGDLSIAGERARRRKERDAEWATLMAEGLDHPYRRI